MYIGFGSMKLAIWKEIVTGGGPLVTRIRVPGS